MGESDPRAYEPDRLARAGVPVGETKVQVLAVVNGFIKKLRDMRVVEAVDDATARPVAHDQAEIPQHSKLMRDGGLFHSNSLGEVGYRKRAVPQLGEDHQPARSRQRLQCGRDLRGGLGIQRR